MNIPFARRSVSVAFASILLGGAALCQCPAVSAFATSPTSTGWPLGASVLIYIYDSSAGTFSETQEIAISTAFSNWNSSEGSSLSLSTEVQTSLGSLPSSGYALVYVGDTSGCYDGASACTHNTNNGSNGSTLYTSIAVLSSSLASSAFPELMDHEVGHTYGQAECGGCGAGLTIMDGSDITDDNPTGPECCDLMLSWNMTAGTYGYQSCDYGGDCGSNSWCAGSISNSLNCTGAYYYCYSGCCYFDGGGGGCIPDGEGCDGEEDSCCDTNCEQGVCGGYTDPIIIDLTGRGYQLTDLAGGVKFNFFPSGSPIQMSWTAAGWNGGFLALDRNGNGRIDNATELFSNITPQPTIKGQPANGFAALAVYDLPANGGNSDGQIDEHDAVFSKLLIWIDKNHNGISEPDELFTMKQAGIQSISLKYALSRWVDAYGNIFRYAAPISINGPSNQTVYDVVLQSPGHSSTTSAAAKQ